MLFIKVLVGITLQLLEVAVAKSTISPSYLWPIRFIYNKKVPVVPPLDVHGDVVTGNVGLQFDGKTSWLDAGELTGSCIAQPQKCTNGLSMVMRAKIISSSTTDNTSVRFLFDSGGFNGEGVSLYTKGEEIVSEVADKSKFWRASSKLQLEKWYFILVTWSSQEGLMLFIDGPLKAQSAQPTNFRLNPVATSNHVVIGKCNAEMGTTFGHFSSDLVAVFDSVTPDGKVYLSYSFSAPSARGNIRYVNAKFINTADFDLIIFPDRGEHQKGGYQLEAHSSTLLEYVLREGPLPLGMNFRLQNKKNGEQLIFNGKYDFHVISSDDKQVVKEFRILPDSRITTITNTAAVSINYKIRPAVVSIEQQLPSSGGNGTNESAVESQNEQSAMVDNPEVPPDVGEGLNNTEQSQTQKTGNQEQGQQMEKTPEQKPEAEKGGTQIQAPVNGTNNTENAPHPQVTTTVIPTLPPPTKYSTKKPNTTQPASSNLNATMKPEQKEESAITSPELPEDGEKVTEQELEGNITKENATDNNGLFEAIEEQGNEVLGSTVGSIGTNITNDTNVKNTTKEKQEKVLEQKGNEVQGNEVLGSTVGSIGTNITNDTNVKNVTKEQEKVQEQNLASNIRPTEGKNLPIAHIDTPNPWLNTAKEVQGQQPINWQNGQGLYKAIDEIKNGLSEAKNEDKSNKYESGIAPVNYNIGKVIGTEEKPVWQYLNGEPEINQLQGQNKFRHTEQNSVGTSPFKFANPKTQKEIELYYTQSKDNGFKHKKLPARA